MSKIVVPSLLIALALAPPVPAQEPADGTDQRLEPVVVTAPRGPSWERTDELHRRLVEATAPCLGCDAVARPQARPAFATLQEYLLRPADQVDEATTLARQVKLQDSPDLQYLRR